MTERDIVIKRCVADFGPLTVDHLIQLIEKEPKLGSSATLWRRLTPQSPLLKAKQVYVRAAARGVKFVYADYDISKRKDLSHDLITTSVHITLYKSFDLLHWQRPREKHKGKLNEDAYFILAHPKGEVHYYLESDTGTEGYAKIEDKLERYLKHYERERQAFFILFVTSDSQRAKDLTRRASRVVPKERRKLYLFTSLPAFAADPNGYICHVPYDQDAYPILPRV